jgi:hypothetical protein
MASPSSSVLHLVRNERLVTSSDIIVAVKSRQILGIAPQKKENEPDYRKDWADKIIEYLNNGIKWKYENTFGFRVDVTRNIITKFVSSLDECLLDEDIGGFVGL